jgi:hypothetical protein
VAQHAAGDSDGDGLSDFLETHPLPGQYASNPTLRDSDSDGLDDGMEFVAGTHPGQAGDVFRLTGTRGLPAGGGFALSWPSVSNRLYRIARIDDLRHRVWTPVSPMLEATPPVNSFTDTTATGRGPWFYRLDIQP